MPKRAHNVYESKILSGISSPTAGRNKNQSTMIGAEMKKSKRFRSPNGSNGSKSIEGSKRSGESPTAVNAINEQAIAIFEKPM